MWEAASPPPLPLEEPPSLPPLPPPPSTQTSNPLCDWLDFGTGAGGNITPDEEAPPTKKARLGDGCPYDSLEEGEISDHDSSAEQLGEEQLNPEQQELPGNSQLDKSTSDDDDKQSGKQEFEIIDDLAVSDDDYNNSDSDDLDEDEIDALLDEGLQTGKEAAVPEDEVAAPVEKEKFVLKGKGSCVTVHFKLQVVNCTKVQTCL